MRMSRFLVPVLLLAAFCFTGCSVPTTERSFGSVPASAIPRSSISSTSPLVGASSSSSVFAVPLSDAFARITKKPFGIRITPASSPVSPERFSGYHTGTDFEAFETETDEEVAVSAICTGKILQKRSARGYGGVVVQACELDGEPLTVVYGHLDLDSVVAKVGMQMKIRERLGLLGEFGPETDGERKHLHLGIHRGPVVDIRGYVATEAALAGWIDVKTLIFP